MTPKSDLSPFAHPKAQRYFATLLERSGFINEVEDTLQLSDDTLELSHARVLSAILILLGRPGIWPDEKRRVLGRAATRLNALSNQNKEPVETTKKKSKPLTLNQHRHRDDLLKAIRTELELLRRRAGVSNRVTEIEQPETWGKFWS